MKKTFQKLVCGATAAVMLLGTAPMAKAATPFTDVKEGAWYDSYVDYVYNNGLMAGTSDTAFSPSQTMTRGMLVTVLHSIAGKPGHSGNNPFGDVGDSWYTNAVIWCYENGIVAGTSANTFSPNSPVTREQMVAILFKFAQANGLDTSGRSDMLAYYYDYADISGWAKDAFSWAHYNGVVDGTSSYALSPKGKATRAQCAVVLQRYHELLTSNAQPQPQPQPTEPAPAPTAPAPTEPKPSEPKPTEPAPAPAPTEPKPTEHVHKWVHHHEDAQGHFERHRVCLECGWSFCIDGLSAEEIALIWMEHQNAGGALGEQHSYDTDDVWVETKPAVDYWTNSDGERVDTPPYEVLNWVDPKDRNKPYLSFFHSGPKHKNGYEPIWSFCADGMTYDEYRRTVEEYDEKYGTTNTNGSSYGLKWIYPITYSIDGRIMPAWDNWSISNRLLYEKSDELFEKILEEERKEYGWD